MKRALLLLAACGGGGHTPDVCQRWAARDPGADARACEALLDAGVPDPAAQTAPTFAAIDCSKRNPSDDRAYAKCRADALAALAALAPALDAPARIRAALDKPGDAADVACGQIADALASGTPDVPAYAAQIAALVDASGVLCHRDVMIHESRWQTCIVAAQSLSDIEDPYRHTPETEQAWTDLIARCPDQKGILINTKNGT